MWVGTSTVDAGGTTGIYLEPPSANFGAPSLSLEDPCGRNFLNLADIYVREGVTSEKVVALYWQNPFTSDRDVMAEMQYLLMETPADGTAPDGASLTTTRWTIAEWATELDAIYKEYVAQARVFNYIGEQAVTSGTADYDLDSFFADTVCGSNLVDLLRLAFVEADGTSHLLQPSDQWVSDHMTAANTTPHSYSLVTEATRTVKLIPTPAANGTLHAIFTGFGADLDGGGNLFSLPDEVVPFVKWGAVATLLAYEDDASDPIRAAWAKARYMDGIEAARLLTGDWYA